MALIPIGWGFMALLFLQGGDLRLYYSYRMGVYGSIIPIGLEFMSLLFL